MTDYHSGLVRRFSTTPPDYQTRNDRNPTLLVSWFCTIFALVIIIIRLLGRWVRTERLFREDKVMFWAIIPLIARMGFVHVILLWGTNNTITTGLSELEIYQRTIGSKLVLPARILYAAYIWIAKVTVVEFLQRLVGQSWIKSYEMGIRIIYSFLGLTFIAVLISTLAECQPFDHYWQVIPDPGFQCRSAIAQLITMGICDTVTNLVLVIFPIPLVMMSAMPVKKKVQLVLLFLLSIILVAITAYRLPSTIARHESQQYRSLLASLEILAATGVANAIVIGSFVRDKGVKKAKFRAASVDDSILARTQTRSKSITMHHWGSDEDLVRDLGLSVQQNLRHNSTYSNTPRPAPIALPSQPPPRTSYSDRRPTINTNWTFNGKSTRGSRRRSTDSASISSTSTDVKLRELDRLLDDDSEPVSPSATRPEAKMGFFDVGGLIDKPSEQSMPFSTELSRQTSPSAQPGANLFLSDIGCLLGTPQEQDDVIREIPSENSAANMPELRGSKRTQEFRDFLRSGSPIGHRSYDEQKSRQTRKVDSSSLQPAAFDAKPDELSFSDAGGLLK